MFLSCSLGPTSVGQNPKACDDSGRHTFIERTETVERFVNQHGGQDALLLCRCCDLEQSLSTEIHRK